MSVVAQQQLTPEFLTHLFNFLPETVLVACASLSTQLRHIVKQQAYTLQIDLNTVNPFAGRWLLRYGQAKPVCEYIENGVYNLDKVADIQRNVLFLRHLRVMSDTAKIKITSSRTIHLPPYRSTHACLAFVVNGFKVNIHYQKNSNGQLEVRRHIASKAW